MQYKTIVMEMLEQRRELHSQLRKDRKLLPAMEIYARELRTSHLGWKEVLLSLRQGSSPEQIASEALEIALKELEDRLPPATPADEDETFSLDQAMAFIRRHTSRG